MEGEGALRHEVYCQSSQKTQTEERKNCSSTKNARAHNLSLEASSIEYQKKSKKKKKKKDREHTEVEELYREKCKHTHTLDWLIGFRRTKKHASSSSSCFKRNRFDWSGKCSWNIAINSNEASWWDAYGDSSYLDCRHSDWSYWWISPLVWKMTESVDIALESLHPTSFDRNSVYRIPARISKDRQRRSRNERCLTVELSKNAL